MSAAETKAGAAGAAKRRLPFFGVYGLICIAVLFFWLFVSIFGTTVSPHTESEIISNTSFAPVGVDGFLGTDYFGRDLLSRIFYGARMTLGLALVATAVAFFLGVGLGFVAGIAGGRVDSAISRVVDAFISFPTIMLALLMVSIVGTSLPALVATIGFIESTRVFRISRSIAINTMTMDLAAGTRHLHERQRHGVDG